MCRRSFGEGHRQEIRPVFAEDFIERLRVENLWMDRIVGGASHSVVNAAREGFGAQPPVNEPFLIPNGLQRGSRYGAEDAGDVRSAERAEACLRPRVVVRIVRVRRRAQAEQYQQRVEISLKEHVNVYPLAEVAAIANVAMDRVELILACDAAALDRQPQLRQPLCRESCGGSRKTEKRDRFRV